MKNIAVRFDRSWAKESGTLHLSSNDVCCISFPLLPLPIRESGVSLAPQSLLDLGGRSPVKVLHGLLPGLLLDLEERAVELVGVGLRSPERTTRGVNLILVKTSLGMSESETFTMEAMRAGFLI